MKDDKKKQTEHTDETHEEPSSEVEQDEQSEDKEDRSEQKKEKKQKNVEDLEKDVEYLKDQLARAVADYRNLEKRHEEDKLEYIRFANKDLLMRLLPAFDMLFLAGKYVEDEGVKLTIKRIEDVFSEIGVKRIETEGNDFDPKLMECVETKDGEHGKVLKEIKPGFTLYDKLLSPATVVVGSGKEEKKEASSN